MKHGIALVEGLNFSRGVDAFGEYHSPNIAFVTNSSGQYTADIENFIQDEVLPLAQRRLIGFQLGDPLTLPKGRGTTYTATRFNRIPLPYAPLSEGVPPVGQSLSISQVTATAQQWGDMIRLTDVAELTIKHPIMNQANFVLGLQIAETLDRNTWNSLLAGTQINYVNQRGSRAAIVAGDVLDPHTINRTVAALSNLGAPMFDGQMETDSKIDAHSGGGKVTGGSPSTDKRASPHFCMIGNDFVLADFAENNTVVLAWTYSDINKLYNYEFGAWRGTRMISSNMLPSWVGVAQINGTAGVAGSGTLAANNYFVQVTASDTQNQYESRVYQVSAQINTVPALGSVNVVLPNISGFTFNVYVGLTSSPGNLGLCSAGPTVGPMAGQATQLAPNQTVVITGLGVAQVPPAAPATGVTVYPTFVIGRGAYGQVSLDEVKITWLDKADKSDPLNQLRVVGWKVFYGTLIENNLFFARIESSSAFSAAFG